jgi:hypothetical protein
MYHDRCDVYKYEHIKDKDGAISTQKSKVALYTDIPCKVSFSLRTWDIFTKRPVDTTPYEKQPKVFLEVEYKLEPGYYMEARRYDPETKEIIAKYEGQLGLSNVCLTHQEVVIDVKGDS